MAKLDKTWNFCLVPGPIRASVEAVYVAKVVSPYVFMIAGMLLRFISAGWSQTVLS